MLAYAEGIERVAADRPKVLMAQALLRQSALSPVKCEVAAQALLELYNVLTKKAKLPRAVAALRIARLRRSLEMRVIDNQSFNDALELAVEHQLQIYDAIILSAAAASRCDILYSEDMQSGFVWRGVEVVNPFAA